MSQAVVIHDFWLGECFLQLLHYALEQEQQKNTTADGTDYASHYTEGTSLPFTAQLSLRNVLLCKTRPSLSDTLFYKALRHLLEKLYWL